MLFRSCDINVNQNEIVFLLTENDFLNLIDDENTEVPKILSDEGVFEGKIYDGRHEGVSELDEDEFNYIDNFLDNKIKEKIPEVTIETTPLPFQDARNYQVSSEKLKTETGFEASIELERGINEVYDLISSNRIKDINDPRYSNQSFLQTFGVS